MGQATTTQNLTDVLNKQISNWSVLYIKLHNYHWFVKGENFFELHRKFEEFYTTAADYIDDLAERLLAIDGKPVATMRDFLQYSTITEAAGNETPQQMVENIYRDFKTIIEETKQGITVAENVKDEPTADMLTDIRAHIEKQSWMLKAYLNK